MPRSGDKIIEVAEERYGKDNPPSAIILTHGHFDHVNGIVELMSKLDVPVHAHPLEFPFLTGQQAWPDPDTSVEGGMLAKISFLYPNEPIDISERLQPLPSAGNVAELPGWEWIHVPGHAPGQIALFRSGDRILISADAFITVKQDFFLLGFYAERRSLRPASVPHHRLERCLQFCERTGCFKSGSGNTGPWYRYARCCTERKFGSPACQLGRRSSARS